MKEKTIKELRELVTDSNLINDGVVSLAKHILEIEDVPIIDCIIECCDNDKMVRVEKGVSNMENIIDVEILDSCQSACVSLNKKEYILLTKLLYQTAEKIGWVE